MSRFKIGANDPCPCGRNRKYKKCCRGHVDWEAIIPQGVAAQIPYLSAQGKNLLFVGLLFGALQLDTDDRPVSRAEFKRAFTSEAVKRIYEAVRFVWPSGEDLKRVLLEDAGTTSGLYIGNYEPDLVTRAVTRHSLYADRILLVDPFTYPDRLREKYNPIVHPEMHRTTALQWAMMWIELWPWIREGIVTFVRSPGDFYPDMAQRAYR